MYFSVFIPIHHSSSFFDIFLEGGLETLKTPLGSTPAYILEFKYRYRQIMCGEYSSRDTVFGTCRTHIAMSICVSDITNCLSKDLCVIIADCIKMLYDTVGQFLEDNIILMQFVALKNPHTPTIVTSVPYSRKVWRIYCYECLAREVWQMDSSNKVVIISKIC